LYGSDPSCSDATGVVRAELGTVVPQTVPQPCLKTFNTRHEVTAANDFKQLSLKWLGEFGGEGGIRTPGTGFGPYNGLANRRLQPLGHLSVYNRPLDNNLQRVS
jgi:hypothetical protein